MNLSSIWESYLNNSDPFINIEDTVIVPEKMPKCGDLNISTKTTILQYNFTLNLEYIFWNIKMISYDEMVDGIIKIQMKFICTDKEQVNEFDENISHITLPVDILTLNKIDNPTGRVKFKDSRKVSIGISKNDVIKQYKKSKSAFYNCLVLIYRVFYKNKFRELHIKLFNSGNIEIPGIQINDIVDVASSKISSILKPFVSHEIIERVNLRSNILVNSNFNCNYNINRDKFVKRIKEEGFLKCTFDSCSYPGIQCKYKLDNGQHISIMIFRTGSILIVGKCEDHELYTIYKYVVDLLERNYKYIYESEYIPKIKKNKKKIKKQVYIA